LTIELAFPPLQFSADVLHAPNSDSAHLATALRLRNLSLHLSGKIYTVHTHIPGTRKLPGFCNIRDFQWWFSDNQTVRAEDNKKSNLGVQ
jgi:hypothetical protein